MGEKEMDMDMVMSSEETTYIPKQIDFDGIMALSDDKRLVVTALINSNGNYRNEIGQMLNDMGLIIDKREGIINEIIK